MQSEGSLPYSQEPVTSPCPEPDESSQRPSTHFSWSVLILSSHLRVALPSDLFPSGFPTKVLYAYSTRATCPAHYYPPWFDHLNNIWLRVQISKPHVVHISFLSCKESLTQGWNICRYKTVTVLKDFIYEKSRCSKRVTLINRYFYSHYHFKYFHLCKLRILITQANLQLFSNIGRLQMMWAILTNKFV
jgi:hypothetical protein